MSEEHKEYEFDPNDPMALIEPKELQQGVSSRAGFCQFCPYVTEELRRSLKSTLNVYNDQRPVGQELTISAWQAGVMKAWIASQRGQALMAVNIPEKVQNKAFDEGVDLTRLAIELLTQWASEE